MKFIMIVYACLLAAIFINLIFMKWVGKED